MASMQDATAAFVPTLGSASVVLGSRAVGSLPQISSQAPQSASVSSSRQALFFSAQPSGRKWASTPNVTFRAPSTRRMRSVFLGEVKSLYRQALGGESSELQFSSPVASGTEEDDVFLASSMSYIKDKLQNLDETSRSRFISTISSMKDELSKKSPADLRRTLAATVAAVTVVSSMAGASLAEDAAAPSVDPARFNRENWIYSQFMEAIKQHEVERVSFNSEMNQAVVIDVNGNRHKVVLPPFNQNLIQTLSENKIDVAVVPTNDRGPANPVADFLSGLILPGLFIAGLYLLSRRGQGGRGGGMGGFGGGPLGMGRSNARVQMEPKTGVTFKDVAGISQAKLELEEIVDFLKDPTKYTAVGAKIPRGVILTGPPGTGKTLLARAVAGEAGVPFFSISGSEFVEMFVGVGASRVRDLFAQAKKNAPCIIFIDEIDAVGRARGGTGGGGGGGFVNDEREQTLNQILTEMDGFEGNAGVIVVAATNRLDILDSALLRPGRFDRQITVDLPDYKERRAILDVHSRGKPLGPNVDLGIIAKRTPGFSGASLANLMNEAAILAARRKKTTIETDEIDAALDRIILGAEKTDRVITEKIKKLVAYHESGHALLGAMMPDYDIVQKVSIIPRGPAGGVTFFAPDEERVDSGMYSYYYLVNQLCVALGGRIAEEIVFGEENVTTGASNDIQQVTNLARRMVTQFGMSKKVGAIRNVQQSFFSGGDQISPETQSLIDREVKELVDAAYERGTRLLLENRAVLDRMAELLIERENIGAEDIKALMEEYGVKKDELVAA
eukprot:CAMPEP_0184657030 /NCGR_PEP_ID=MMETSP0308-20130426/16920_1 /TAXON_ID=38269 /ORGANISM="Gloeochaete witrockiana, Strain SAG 46.84" /LENGTH=786 /DNA_ID=CAMNT_0027094397 /DNA_START=76 /DNA_END=2436 /DNA_ORIENTATION=+